jgi:predicted glutamine amidotransferase
MCGLVGFYPKKNKEANLNSIYLLFILNEVRGTDSCGISIANKRIVGINKKSKARDFLESHSKEISEIDRRNKPMIAHTRQSTNGAHNDDNAHPFHWYDSKIENSYFLFAHNGVIKDLETFKKTINVNSEGYRKLIHIDSHVLGLGMYNVFFTDLSVEKVVKNYEGNAAFICYDHNNKFMVWKGANNNVEERPLFYVENKEGWYFCSLKESLALVFPNDQIVSLKNNELLTFENFKLSSSTIYERKITVYEESNYRAGYSPMSGYETRRTVNNGIFDSLKNISLDNLFKSKTTKTNSKLLKVSPKLSYHPLFNDIHLHTNSAKYSNNLLKYVDEKSLAISGTYKVISTNNNIINSLYYRDMDLKESKYNNELLSFSDGFIVKNSQLYWELKKKYEDFCKSSTSPDTDFFLQLNRDIIEKTVNDFIVFSTSMDTTILYRDIYTNEVRQISLYDYEEILIKSYFDKNDIYRVTLKSGIISITKSFSRIPILDHD